jgi:hypothetical protein
MATGAAVSTKNLLNEGRELLEQHEPVEPHHAFGNWVSEVTELPVGEEYNLRWSPIRIKHLQVDS